MHQVLFAPAPRAWGKGVGGRGGRFTPPSAAPLTLFPPRRFLRGTCKKTDGTCPFSHHVSKEKVSAPTASRSPAPVLPGGGLGASPFSHHEQGGPCTWHPLRGAEPGWCRSGAATRLREAGLAELLLQQLFPLRNLKRISIFLPNRALKLCCEQFGNSRRVSGSLAPAPEPVHILSCLMWAPFSCPELMLLLFVWTWWVQTRLIEMRTQFPLDNGCADS